jgi:pimeloyl-ACP methyl ester carboxylesterase
MPTIRRREVSMNRRELLKLSAQWLGAGALAGCASRELEPAHAGTVDTPGSPLDAAAFESLRRFARLPQGEAAYVAHGRGPAALFLHGFPLNGFQWRGSMALLSPYRRCVAPDFLGMGASRAADGHDVGPEAQADMLAALMDALSIRDADFIANDSGGAVAQLMLVRHPARVRSLLLTNCDTELESPPPAMRPVIELARDGKFVDQWLMPWLSDPALARSAQGIGAVCYTNAMHPTDEALRMYFQPLAASAERKQALHRYAAALDRNALAGTRAALRACAVPVRVVWGMSDDIFKAENADFLAGTFGNSMGVRRLPEAKLFWPEERPELVAAQARLLWASAYTGG